MKKILFALNIAIASYCSYAQTNTFPSSGNVGISTTTPLAKTSIVGSSSAGDGSDQIGIMQITTGTGVNTDNKLLSGVHNSDYSWIQAVQPGSDIRNLSFNPMGGNVGIGTTTPKEALSVNGNIRSKQVKVETNNWPDYVFKKDYKLPSLAAVKVYITQNQHLPDMPSETEVIKMA